MGRLRGWISRRRSVLSWLGWPVPAPVALASMTDMQFLTRKARERNYSRKGEGLACSEGECYFLFPYLRESTPDRSWMCLVVAFSHSLELQTGERPRCYFSRLDVAVSDWNALPVVRGRRKDQLIHWLAGEAFRGAS